MADILVIDDDPVIQAMIRESLRSEGHNLMYASSGEDGLALLQHATFDLLLLDVVMPGIDGHMVCRRLRSNPFYSELPIIFLTSKDRPHDVVSGLDTGADDYISKSDLFSELAARIRAVLRRTGIHSVPESLDALQVKDIIVHRRQPLLHYQGFPVQLTTVEHRLIYVLMQNLNRPVSVDQLLEDAWEYYPGTGDPKVVRVAVTRLRKKLSEQIGTSLIDNVHGHGYIIAS